MKIFPLSRRMQVVFWACLFCAFLMVVVWIGVWGTEQSLSILNDKQLGSQDESLVTVTMLDVGQGDAFHIRTDDGVDLLIDGGPDASVLEGLGNSMPFFDRSIELVVLTHPDADHVTGLVHVLERYDVQQVMHTGIYHESNQYDAFLEDLETEGSSEIRSCAGSSVELEEDVHLQVLYPIECQISGEYAESTNNTSVVLRLDVHGTRFLFTGDLEKEGEENLLESVGDRVDKELRADVLKVGHHGSVTSTSVPFLDAISPSVVLFSVGAENSYGHPHARTVSVFDERNIEMLRTDRDGDVVCEVFAEGYTCD